MKHLYFMRHGLSVMNMQGVFSGSIDTPLAELGIKQCHLAAHHLNGVLIDAIVCSPMKRTVESAKIICQEISFPEEKIIVSELFVERSFGPLEGTDYSTDLNLDQTGGVEHSSSLINRAQLGLDLLNSLEADTILVVSHGAIGRALRHVINPSLDYYHMAGFNNAEVVKLI